MIRPVLRSWMLPAIAGLLALACAWQATLVAAPYALMSAALQKIGNGTINSFIFTPPYTASYQPIVRPSPDLAYAGCVFDLAKGPVLLDIEPVPDHYWSVSIFDARTDVASVRSDRDTGGKPARLALIRKGMDVPSGYEAVTLDYDKGLAVIRVLMADKAEFAAIDAVRRKSRCGENGVQGS